MPILWNQRHTRTRRGARRSKRAGPSVDGDRAGVGACETDERLEQLGPAGSHEAKQRDDLAGPDRKRYLFEARAAGDARRAQQRLAPEGDRRLPTAGLRNDAADHGLDDAVGSHLVALERRDVPAVAHRGDSIAHAEHFRQTMRHVNERDARSLQVVQDSEEVIGFGRGQRRGGLVERQDSAIEGESPRHLEELAVRERQPIDRRIGGDWHMKAREQVAGLIGFVDLVTHFFQIA